MTDVCIVTFIGHEDVFRVSPLVFFPRLFTTETAVVAALVHRTFALSAGLVTHAARVTMVVGVRLFSRRKKFVGLVGADRGGLVDGVHFVVVRVSARLEAIEAVHVLLTTVRRAVMFAASAEAMRITTLGGRA